MSSSTCKGRSTAASSAKNSAASSTVIPSTCAMLLPFHWISSVWAL